MKKTGFRSKVRPMKISVEAGNVLRELKDSPFWGAIKEYMVEYSRFHRDMAFFLNETQEDFIIKHARHTSRCDGLVDFKRFIEDGLKRESDDE